MLRVLSQVSSSSATWRAAVRSFLALLRFPFYGLVLFVGTIFGQRVFGRGSVGNAWRGGVQSLFDG